MLHVSPTIFHHGVVYTLQDNTSLLLTYRLIGMSENVKQGTKLKMSTEGFDMGRFAYFFLWSYTIRVLTWRADIEGVIVCWYWRKHEVQWMLSIGWQQERHSDTKPCTVYRYQLSLCLITYFYLPSLSSPFSVWGHGGMMLKSMWNVLVFPERMHRSRTNGGWRVKGQLDNLVYFVGWPLNGCGVLCGRIPLMA